MKVNLHRKLTIATTLNASEMIMFNKGGMHKVKLPLLRSWEEYDEMEVTVQIEQAEQYKFDFIANSAAKHKESMGEAAYPPQPGYANFAENKNEPTMKML